MPSSRSSSSVSRHAHGPSEIWTRRHVVNELALAQQALGARLRKLRTSRGLSQERAAELMGVHAKYLQRLESGRANPALGTLIAAALAFGVSLRSLLDAEARNAADPDVPFHVADATTARPFIDCVPLYPLRVAAGALRPAGLGSGNVEPDAWVVPHGRKRPSRGHFVAQVEGHSMNKLIPNGAFCLWKASYAGPRNGRVLLVRHPDLHDPDVAGDFTVKRWREEKPGGRKRRTVVLVPESDVPSYEPIRLSAAQVSSIEVVAELVEVLPGASPFAP